MSDMIPDKVFGDTNGAGVSPENAAYIVAHYVHIPGDSMRRWLAVMEMCGFEITKKDAQ